MATFTKTVTIPIGAAIPAFTASVLTILPTYPSGVASSARKLTWPNNDLPPLDYDTNPIFTKNFEIEPLISPATTHIQTLGGGVVDRSPGFIQDKPVTEIWPADPSGESVSMRAEFFRSLRNYEINKPDAGQFIIWEPKDKTIEKYYIEIIRIETDQIRSNRPLEEFIESEVRLVFMIRGIVP